MTLLHQLSSFALSAMAVAGIAVIWRNWLADHPTHKEFICQKLGRFHKMLTCGSCFTYWAALGFTLAAPSLPFWTSFGQNAFGISLDIFSQWMALSWLSVFLRFLYVALQEHVRLQVHDHGGKH